MGIYLIVIPNLKLKTLELTDSGYAKVSSCAATTDLTFPEAVFYVRATLAGHYLYRRDREYIVEREEVVLLDHDSGRPLHGRRLEFGVQQAIEIKECLPLTPPNAVIDQITLHSFLAPYRQISGMSGSAFHNALEFRVSYGLDVIPIPPNRPSLRVDADDVVYRTKGGVVRAVADEVTEAVGEGRPVLIGTVNIEDAEAVADACAERGLDVQLLSAKNHSKEAAIITEAGQAGG